MAKKPDDIAKQLKDAILNAGINQRQLSLRCGVAPAVLSRFVSGQRTITIETAAKVANVLGLKLVKDKHESRVKVK